MQHTRRDLEFHIPPRHGPPRNTEPDDKWEAHVCAVSLSECVMQGIIEVGDALCAVDDVDVYGQPLCELGKRGTCDDESRARRR